MKARTGVVGLLGALGGVWLGSRSVRIYDWRTEWTIPAPLPVVYEALTSREALHEWWPDMELLGDTGGDELRVGSTVSCASQCPAGRCWRALGHRLIRSGP
jgi:hypothetical protein